MSLVDQSKIINFEDAFLETVPHVVSEVMCVRCLHRWLALRPDSVLLKDLECPNCGPGAVIETGECLDNLTGSADEIFDFTPSP